MMLEFNIRNQEISRIDNFSPAEKSVEYLIAKFNFKTEDWNEAIKRAIFRNVKMKVEKDAMIEDDSCVVPWEVLVGSGDIEVSVHGVINTKDITTDVAVFNLNRTLQGGSATQEPSPTVYEQMVEMVKDAKEVAQSVRDDADNGKFNGQQGDPGKDGKSAYQYAVEGGFKGTEQEFIDSMGKAGQVDLTGYVSKEEHEAELLKAFVKVTTDKASFHHITDSANMKVVEFGMEGITEQETTPGNQLFDFKSDKWSTSIGNTNKTFATVTLVDDGIKLVNNVVESNKWVVVFYEVDVKPNVQYQIKAKHNHEYPLAVCDSSGNTIGADLVCNGSYIRSFTSPSDGKIYIKFSTTRGSTEPNDSTYTDVMLAVDASVYEPFTNGPSPNPTHPQDIKLAGVYNEATGRYEHKGCVGNKNIMSPFIYDGGLNYDNGSFNAATTTPTRKTTDFIYFDITKTYYLSIGASSIAIFGYDVNKEFVARTPSTVSSSKLFTKDNLSVALQDGKTRDDIVYIRCMVYLVDGSYDEQIQLELGSTGTPCTPHASQPFTITSDRPLTKWDNLVKVDGKWYWDYKQLKLVVDGTLKWSASATGFMAIALPGSMRFREAFCNQLRVITIEKEAELGKSDICYLGRTSAILFCNNSRFYDDTLEDKGLANWKAHLNEHPLEIYTYKDESELVPLLDEEQELLRNLEMYYGVTNVYNEQGCPMWFKYCADQELHWNQKLLQIQQAII